MKSPRPRPFHLRAALAALTLLLLARAIGAQDSKPAQTPETKPGQNIADPLRAGGAVKRAEVTAKPEPKASCATDDDTIPGVVRLRAILSSSGDVTNISVIKGLPGGLTEKAIAAAKQIRFTPAEKDGRKVSQYVTLEYSFNVYREDDAGEVTKKVSITEQPPPAYTDEALKNRVAGTVVVEALFCKDGRIDSPEVVHGLPDGLSEKALEAALRIKFAPAEINGRKVSVVRRIEYVFSPDAHAPTAPKP